MARVFHITIILLRFSMIIFYMIHQPYMATNSSAAMIKPTLLLKNILCLTIVDHSCFKVGCFSSEVSNHFFVQLFVESECSYERGRSYWKLNDSVLSPNEKYINSLLSSFPCEENGTVFSTYDKHKSVLRDTLRTMCFENYKVEKESYNWLSGKWLNILNKVEDKSASIEDIKYFDQINTSLLVRRRQADIKPLKHFKALLNDCENGLPSALKSSTKENTLNNLSFVSFNGEIHSECNAILNSFKVHFSKLYSNSTSMNYERQSAIIDPFCDYNAVSSSESLCESITINEVECAIRKLNPHSAPVPDGITSNCYKQFCKKISPYLVKVFNGCYVRQEFRCSMEKAVIKVLPKMDSPQSVDYCRPIILINSDAKIFAHILAERAEQMFHNLNQKHQHAYLNGRQINLARSKISKSVGSVRAHDNVLINIDFTKAFDTIDGPFISLLLEKLKVPGVFLNCVKALHRRTSSYVEINGLISPIFSSERGVRQGCPLSSILFVLALEPLLQSIQSEDEIRDLSPSKVESCRRHLVYHTQKQYDSIVRVIRQLL